MSEKTSSGKQQRSIILYLLIAFVITWLCWIPALVVASRQGFELPMIGNLASLGNRASLTGQQRLLTSMFSFAVYGPLIAAVSLTFLERGKDGLMGLLRRIVKFQVPLKWYGIVIGLALVIPLLPWLFSRLIGQAQTGATAWTLPLIAVLFLRQLLTSGLGEEPGWRGYLLPRLQAAYGGSKAVWILGIIWAVWHYPITISETLSNMTEVPLPAMIITLLVALAGQTISLIGMTYLYVWIYNNTCSVWLVILFHALTNTIPAILLAGISPTFSILMAAMPWVVVFVLEKVAGKESFPGEPA